MDAELQSRLESLYLSNEPPSSQDATLISEILQDRRARIFELEKNLVKFRMEIKFYESLLSGIRKLPPELLAEIFMHYATSCRDGRDFSGYYFYPRPHTDGPMRISAVCRTWRAIVFSTPTLWNYISLPHRTPFGCTNYAELVERCITNSRVSPLYIKVSVFGSPERYRTAEARNLKYSGALDTLDKFMPEMYRWNSFHLDMFASRSICTQLERKLPSIPPTGAPNLMEMYFRAFTPDRDALEVAWALELLCSSINLRKILFVAPIWDLEAAPWESLQHFESKQGMRLRDLFLVLRGCPALQYCEVCFELEEEPPCLPSFTESDPVIVLSQLHTLRLTHLRQAELSTVLQWITVPTLTELTLAGHHVSDTWLDPLFISFLSRSACRLHTLSLSQFSYSDANIMNYLRLPNVHDTLETLELDKWRTPISQELLDFLTFKFSEGGPSLILPKLKNITFTIHAIVQAVRLREFFLSRWYEPERNHAAFPVQALQEMRALLLVPVKDMVELHFETCIVDGGTDYPEIEKLAGLDMI
ncbi:hypothetical protein BT96DRAFT_707387 [Gymnopus androsaceus JB14]|uniref:F-box domain-containing protein n=1 Tax=Gymnopus androsaceus JB14 TaxID=1447944 RepID=A0A6A4HKW0_9AGAR|nr:hypothetical protein BT96DRAFT_707387 [Gymnopus androsaceus JB14]